MNRRAERPIEIATIRDITTDGRGVADTPGKTVFIDAALTGERVSFQRQRKRKQYDQASLVEVLEASPERAEPPCDYFGICGGCSLQHLSPEAQVELKQQSLLDQLQRIASLVPDRVLEPLTGMPLGYRRRARLGARYVDKKNRLLVGFREKHKPYIADMQSCKTLASELSQLIGELTELIAKLSIVRKVPQIELSLADNALGMVWRVMETPSSADIEYLQQFEAQKNAIVWLQTGGPDTLALLSPERHGESPELYYRLPEYDLQLNFGPLDFIQVNAEINQRMVAQALELADPQPTDRVLDLFCGIGNFSLPMAQRAAQVVGVELDPRMVMQAQANANQNGLPSAEFFAADLSKTDEDTGAMPPWWGEGFDIVVLDPPRSGAQEVLAKIAASGARKIVYVSCHPGSLARDAGILTAEHGYRLVAAGAMDMFPQTAHVEAMALFETAG
jgi:23S rRNA (uracil1939-C5)-methyltransferase